MADDFSERYGDLLTGSYDCVHRVVLNAYYPLGHNPGGFRTWWRRLHDGSDAQVILNGHEYVAVTAQGEGIGFVKEGNCFTGIADPQGLARIADALSQPAAIGRPGQACERWIYTACLCFGLDTSAQQRSGFRYCYSVYQAEYSRNLLFRSGRQMEDLFNRVLDRTRSRLHIPRCSSQRCRAAARAARIVRSAPAGPRPAH